MACTRIAGGFVCGPDRFVAMEQYGAKVWMEWHNYLGPTFYRSAAAITAIRVPSRKTWLAFKRWHEATPDAQASAK